MLERSKSGPFLSWQSLRVQRVQEPDFRQRRDDSVCEEDIQATGDLSRQDLHQICEEVHSENKLNNKDFTKLRRTLVN